MSALTELLDPNWISWEGMVGIDLNGSGLAVWLLGEYGRPPILEHIKD